MFKKKLSFDEKIKRIKYDRVYGILQEILDTSVTKPGEKDRVDYEATCSVIKTKVRLVKEFADSLTPSPDKK